MCIEVIIRLKKEFNLPIQVCDECLGDGNIATFCGHYVEETCEQCKGKGYLNGKINKSTQTHSKTNREG
jgi:DnaJ-class molecular chaperone